MVACMCMLSRFNCVQLYVTLWYVACQAPLSMGFSRQEYQSGLPCPLPGDLPHPGIEPRSPALQADSLPSEPPGKLKNTGMGSLSLLQGIFLTQESNQRLLHCKWILYQLSYQGSLVVRAPHFFTAESLGSTNDWGIKILQASSVAKKPGEENLL